MRTSLRLIFALLTTYSTCFALELSPHADGSHCEEKTVSSKYGTVYDSVKSWNQIYENVAVASPDQKTAHEIQKAIASIRKALHEIHTQPEIYTDSERGKLTEIAWSPDLHIRVVDGPLPVAVPGTVQNGAGLSGWEKRSDGKLVPVMYLQKDSWQKQSDSLAHVGLVHHELCVIAGCETTGDYHKTEPFKKEFKDGRSVAWLKTETCTLGLFEQKKDDAGKSSLGKYLGGSAIYVPGAVSGNGFTTLTTENPKRVLRLLYVLGSGGYLRIRVIESDPIPPQDDRLVIQKNGKTLIEDQTVFNSWDHPSETVQSTKDVLIDDRYVLRTSCAHDDDSF